MIKPKNLAIDLYTHVIMLKECSTVGHIKLAWLYLEISLLFMEKQTTSSRLRWFLLGFTFRIHKL